MQKRICPNCFTRWYSSDNRKSWKCENCGHDIPVPKDNEELDRDSNKRSETNGTR